LRLAAGKESRLSYAEVADWNDDQIDAELIIAEEFARMEKGQPTSRNDYGFDGVNAGKPVSMEGDGGEGEGQEGESPFLIDWENLPIEKAQEYVRNGFNFLTQ